MERGRGVVWQASVTQEVPRAAENSAKLIGSDARGIMRQLKTCRHTIKYMRSYNLHDSYKRSEENYTI